MAVVGDLTTEGLAERVVAEAVERHGRLDGLVNNAALVLEGDLLGTDMDNWRRTMQLNVEVPFPWCKAAVPAMLEGAAARSSTSPRPRGSSPGRTTSPT